MICSETKYMMNEDYKKENASQLFAGNTKYQLMVDNKYTLQGALCEYWIPLVEGARRWNNPNTRKAYCYLYLYVIIPNFPNHNEIALEDSSAERIKGLLDNVKNAGTIKNGNRTYSEGSIKKIFQLFKDICRVVMPPDKFEDLFEWTDIEVYAKRLEKIENKKGTTKTKRPLRHYFTPEQHLIIARNLLGNNPKSYSKDDKIIQRDGIYFGCLLMYDLGLRNHEACVLRFKDIGEDGIADISHSYSSITHTDVIGGKTENMVRLIPVSERTFDMIKVRKEYITEEYRKKGENVESEEFLKRLDDFPIACKGNSYEENCSPSDINRVFRKIFKEIHFSQEEMADYYVEMKEEEKKRAEYNQLNKIDELVESEDATSYVNRRNFATVIKMLGIQDDDAHFIFGHKIEDPRKTRNDFRDSDFLNWVKERLRLRTYLNYPKEKKYTVFDTEKESGISFKDSSCIELRSKGKKRIGRIHVYANAIVDDILIELPENAKLVNGERSILVYETNEKKEAPSVIESYLKRYRERW